jgi:ribosome-associated protein
MTEGRELVDRIVEAAADKKAIDIRVLEVGEIVGYTDFFVVCSGNTERQVNAIKEGIYDSLKRDGVMPRRVEGEREAHWVLMDYLDAVVHIFTPETREYYRLEQLWGEAPARSVV